MVTCLSAAPADRVTSKLSQKLEVLNGRMGAMSVAAGPDWSTEANSFVSQKDCLSDEILADVGEGRRRLDESEGYVSQDKKQMMVRTFLSSMLDSAVVVGIVLTLHLGWKIVKKPVEVMQRYSLGPEPEVEPREEMNSELELELEARKSKPSAKPSGIAAVMFATRMRRARRQSSVISEPRTSSASQPPGGPSGILAALFASRLRRDPGAEELGEPEEEEEEETEDAVDVVENDGAAANSAQLEDVGAQAEAEVERLCDFVRLRMKQRLIELLRPIRFYGSKHKEGVDVYVNILEAEQICKEVAIAFSICNNLLIDQGLLPIGLAVEGHTSASADGHAKSMRISTLRAEQCQRSLKHHLHAIQIEAGTMEKWGAPVDELIQHRGFGSTKPLPGFDDGENYEVNRRVEMRLVEPHQEGYRVGFEDVAAGTRKRRMGKLKKKKEAQQRDASSNPNEKEAQLRKKKETQKKDASSNLNKKEARAVPAEARTVAKVAEGNMAAGVPKKCVQPRRVAPSVVASPLTGTTTRPHKVSTSPQPFGKTKSDMMVTGTTVAKELAVVRSGQRNQLKAAEVTATAQRIERRLERVTAPSRSAAPPPSRPAPLPSPSTSTLKPYCQAPKLATWEVRSTPKARGRKVHPLRPATSATDSSENTLPATCSPPASPPPELEITAPEVSHSKIIDMDMLTEYSTRRQDPTLHALGSSKRWSDAETVPQSMTRSSVFRRTSLPPLRDAPSLPPLSRGPYNRLPSLAPLASHPARSSSKKPPDASQTSSRESIDRLSATGAATPTTISRIYTGQIQASAATHTRSSATGKGRSFAKPQDRFELHRATFLRVARTSRHEFAKPNALMWPNPEVMVTIFLLPGFFQTAGIIIGGASSGIITLADPVLWMAIIVLAACIWFLGRELSLMRRSPGALRRMF